MQKSNLRAAAASRRSPPPPIQTAGIARENSMKPSDGKNPRSHDVAGGFEVLLISAGIQHDQTALRGCDAVADSRARHGLIPRKEILRNLDRTIAEANRDQISRISRSTKWSQNREGRCSGHNCQKEGEGTRGFVHGCFLVRCRQFLQGQSGRESLDYALVRAFLIRPPAQTPNMARPNRTVEGSGIGANVEASPTPPPPD